ALRRLGGLPADLANPAAWTSASTVDAEVPDDHTVVAVGVAAPDAAVTVSGGADPLTEPLVELWRRGVDVRWDRHPVAAGGRVPLPTNEFDRVELRVVAPADWPARPAEAEEPAPAPSPEPAGSVVDLRAEWVATNRVPAPPIGGPVLVVTPPGTAEVRAAARRLGDVRFVEPGAGDWTAEAEKLKPSAVVLLVPRDPGGDPTPTAVTALELTKAVYGRQVPVLAVGPTDRGGVAPELATLAGLARCLRRETDTVALRAVAVPGALADPSTWDVVADELGRLDGGELVRHGDGGRVTRRYATAPGSTDAAEPVVRAGGVYLVTGGAGGLGRLLANHLLAVPGTRVALVGRSPESDVDLTGLDRDRVAYLRADIADLDATTTAVAAARNRFGPLTGVIHTAGVLRDGYLLHTAADDVRAVLAPKARGALNLDRATRHEPLELFVLYSSVVAVVGNVGQSGYAMANAFLDEFAAEREALRAVGERAGRALSIGWPVWRDGGMTIGGRGVLGSDMGMLPMPAAVALAALDRLLATGAGAHAFLYGDPELLPGLLDQDIAETTEDDTPAAPEPDQVVAWAREYVATTVAELRGVRPAEIDLELGLDRFGLDSIVISEFNAKTDAALGSVGETLLFECRTLGAAAERIAKLRPAELTAKYGNTTTSAPVPVPDPTSEVSTVDEPDPNGDVAIIGIAGRYPKAPDLDAFWRNLAGGRDCVTEVPAARWDHRAHAAEGGAYCGSGAFLDGVDEFDPLFFSISPREAELMDPQERLFLQASWHAFEDAGYPPHRLGDNRDVGVFVGVTTQTYLLRAAGRPASEPVAPPSPQWSIANRVSYWLDLRGPSMPVDTACAASLTAIHLAMHSLARGECAMALVGGVNLYLHPAKYDWLCQLGMLSRTGHCHTFGADADGFVPGEGVGAVVLKPLRAALADGDRVLGVVKGTAVNHGGRTNGFTVPNPNAQAELIRSALADAGVDPGTIGYVEAHGTGTALGDPVEVAGLTQAYPGVPAGACAIGSVKTNIGHLESASGLAGLTKVLLQLEHGRLVPSLHSTEHNPRIDFATTPFTVAHDLADWPRRQRDGAPQPRRAGISSFGAGGANAHV
ncbi:MAG TPA: type I polyketide synthase, partial [Actinophytocola sp.]|nr:type I polyketide synthase [Actinophytocola sp.]